MKKIVAKTLQEAITQASVELSCSVTELDYEIIQVPSKGFLGLGKKEAIIVASSIKNNQIQKTSQETPVSDFETPSQTYQKKPPSSNPPSSYTHPTKPTHAFETNLSRIDETFFKESSDSGKITQEIQKELQELFTYMPYKINKINVEFYDSQTILINLDGEDSALMIGEKGYRYKALSYLLFNWIHPKYSYNIRLEIAQFLKNQEEAIDIYLQSIINTIYETGKAQTKPLDGILAYIALKKLREIFPNKYISFRTNALQERYIIINDFIRNG